MTDSELQRRILLELELEPSVQAAHIGVAVKEGVVTLTGHVPTYTEKVAAEQAVKRLEGVKAVANELDVKLPGGSQRTDEDIAAAAVNALKSTTLVPADRITVVVRDGWITLEGKAEWEYQKQAAEDAVSHLPGVKGITNLIKVKPSVAPINVKSRIRDAFRRLAESETRSITVDVDGSKVILRGWVRSFAEKDQAEQVAWSAPGVTQVESHIVIAHGLPGWIRAACFLVLIAVLVIAIAWPALAYRNAASSPDARGSQSATSESNELPNSLPSEPSNQTQDSGNP